MSDAKLSVLEPGTEVLVLVDGVVAVEATVVTTEPASGSLEGQSKYDFLTVFVRQWGREDYYHRRYVFPPSEMLRMAYELDELALMASCKARRIREGQLPLAEAKAGAA